MHPLKVIILALLLLAWLRWLAPLARRPAGSALLPFAALGLSIWHFVAIGPDMEMAPALLLALWFSAGVVWEFRSRTRMDEPASRSYWHTLARGAGLVGAGGLLGLATLLSFFWIKSDPVIRGPETLPAVTIARAATGNASHVAGEVGAHASSMIRPAMTVVAEHSFLRTPRDLEFNPRVPGQLWIVNGADNSVAIIHDAHTDAPSIEYRRDGHAAHFMHRPSALAFGSDQTSIDIPGTFATAQESRDDAIPFMARNFMGPTLFSSDLTIFAHHPGPGLSGSHLDMLHESPLAMGIAWERDHVYWVFGGYLGNIVRYDFVADHGIGQHDHTNGIIRHYGQDVVKRVAGVPSHLAVHHATQTLYIADTGNRRILALDMTAGAVGEPGPGWEPDVDTRWMEGAAFTELVPPGTMTLPSGLELAGDHLYVSDYATGLIHVFDLAGTRIATLDTGLGEATVMGITFGPDGLLYFTDAASNRILRIDASLELDAPGADAIDEKNARAALPVIHGAHDAHAAPVGD